MKSRNFARQIFTCMFAVASFAAAPGPAQAITLKSVDITLPDSDRDLPDGPGLAAVQGNCISCHSPGMILTQPAMPKAAWEAEVAKMRNVYKAPVSEKDVPDIVSYLTAIKGTK
ncbi:MAG TPA: cytochrome c [Xanthobacteraceae bacterium]|jgi:mono/diheme cytochrome c family protein|nr:cytochrome c [Xanthobacteraceae bacterium]